MEKKKKQISKVIQSTEHGIAVKLKHKDDSVFIICMFIIVVIIAN